LSTSPVQLVFWREQLVLQDTKNIVSCGGDAETQEYKIRDWKMWEEKILQVLKD